MLRRSNYLILAVVSLLIGCQDRVYTSSSEVKSDRYTPSNELTREDSLSHLFFIAQKLEREADSLPALMFYEQAYLLDPQSTFLLDKVSYLSMALNQPGTMIRALQQGQKLDELADSTLRTISAIYGRYRLYEAAILTLYNLDQRELDDSLFLIHLYEQNHQYDSAIVMYTALFPVMPATIKAKVADLYRISSNFAQAEEMYQQVLSSGDTLPGVQEGLALTYLAQKNDSLGIAILDSLVRNGERKGELNPLARQILASYWWSKRMGDKAITVYAPLYTKSGVPEDVNFGRTLGVYYYLIGNYAKSEEILAEVLTHDVSERYEVLYLYGASLEGVGKVKEAPQAYREALTVEPKFSEARQALTLLYIRTNLLDSALIEAKALAENDSTSVSGWALAGAVCNMVEDYQSAVHYLQKAAQISDKNISVLFEYAIALERTGDAENAIPLFHKVIALDSSHAAASNYLSYLFAESDTHIDEAAVLIQKALQIAPENGAYLDTYGWVLYRQGKFQEAYVQLEKALSLMEEKDYVVYLHLGYVSAALGNKKEAQAYFEKAKSCANAKIDEITAALETLLTPLIQSKLEGE